jgi:hypothetical protein
MVVFSGWFLVTIMAPLTLPVIGLLVLRLLPIPGPPSGLKVMTTVKDGQLGWAVIAMGASAIYELWGAKESHKFVPGWGGGALGALIFVMLSAILVAACGAAFSTPLLDTASGGAKAWAKHYKLFVFSAIMTTAAAFLYTCIHFSLSP